MSTINTTNLKNPSSASNNIEMAANGSTTFQGTIVGTERTITAVAFDLSTGNNWTCGNIAIPNPTNAVAGTSGLIRITAGPTSWASNFKHSGGSAPTIGSYPAIVPFYVVSSSQILVGKPVEGMA
jgi:hypothetical protein